ncbi:hypothetical protein [Mycolicibacterium rhodesiae]|uniref:Uncharacterized protein n=1 Tax=Mycolicibacterium rhodesiae TaxID=36814 RepID=A0A1X0IQV0_MYCRH|nr:hypothetical protein [Mycolicibacterium rhodesiae]MCV7346993.1 hypothetical protein [Mycolicibacterium rhodesiae]ORB50807.1 hypothetical protein BST42_18750 [Mycolicibacterium rhodesiae]
MICTHPDNWPCSGTEDCNSQKVRDAQLMLSEGHARLTDVPGVADDDESLRVGWTGKSEPVIGLLTEDELDDWDELGHSGEYVMPKSRDEDD